MIKWLIFVFLINLYLYFTRSNSSVHCGWIIISFCCCMINEVVLRYKHVPIWAYHAVLWHMTVLRYIAYEKWTIWFGILFVQGVIVRILIISKIFVVKIVHNGNWLSAKSDMLPAKPLRLSGIYSNFQEKIQLQWLLGLNTASLHRT